MNMSFVGLHNLTRRYDETLAVSSVSLEVERGEFFGLLGPSGCGKTTTLRMLAGLETPDDGWIEFDGRNITRIPAEQRGFGMVFQNYALFPHMDVFENVAFGLRSRGRSQAEVAERVASALDLVKLPGFAKRRVDEMSGGQQQRVAIARAVAFAPALLLFDEPLSNLDVALREEMRGELREMVSRLGLTAVYVTHDQDEAFALCDRIAVMMSGRVLQTGRPRDLYEQPARTEVARFLGRNNLIEAERLDRDAGPSRLFRTLRGNITLAVSGAADDGTRTGAHWLIAIRPEHVVVRKTAPDEVNTLRGVVMSVVFGGATTTITVDVNGLGVEALLLEAGEMTAGDQCFLTLPARRLMILPADSVPRSDDGA